MAELQNKSRVIHKDGAKCQIYTKCILKKILEYNRLPIKTGNIAIVKQCWKNCACFHTVVTYNHISKTYIRQINKKTFFW